MATIEEKIAFLSEEVNLLTTRIRSAGTGYLYTTIDTLSDRIAELKQEAADNMTESEKMQEELEPLPFR